jgi:glutathione S-transferase
VARELRRAGVEVQEVRAPQRRRFRDEVQALSGQRRVPVLVIDGEPICDSHRIIEHLEWRAGGARDEDT